MTMREDGVKLLIDGEALMWGMETIAKRLGISRSTLERLRNSGEFPKPDRHAGRRPLWLIQTVSEWAKGNN